MFRRKFLQNIARSGLVTVLPVTILSWKNSSKKNKINDRDYWCDLLYKIANPVFLNLSKETLVKNMKVEKSLDYDSRKNTSYLEAVGRTAAGIAPWLALSDDDSEESKLRETLRYNFLAGIKNGVNPSSVDYLNFKEGKQAIVDSAYLAHAFLRAPKALWEPLDEITKERVIVEFKSLRNRKPHNNNWLIFRAITEVFLMSVNEDWKKDEVFNAIDSFENWYVGDGWYSDGDKFSMNYYNSFAMHPMLVDTLKTLLKNDFIDQEVFDRALKRMLRFIVQQERMISPEGTYPIIGRSLTYRTGAFQALSMIALMEKLPKDIEPSQVRCALTAVKKKLLVKGVFDKDGWLQLGFCGHQPEMADYYTSTGSLYMTTLSFLPLGLPVNNDFWSGNDKDWSSKKAWKGNSISRDFQVQY